MLRKILVLLLSYLVIAVIDGTSPNVLVYPIVVVLVLQQLEIRALRKQINTDDPFKSIFD